MSFKSSIGISATGQFNLSLISQGAVMKIQNLVTKTEDVYQLNCCYLDIPKEVAPTKNF